MSSHPTLLPSLLALHPSPTLPLLLSRLSLLALHIEPYYSRDDIYTATTSILPGQLRKLRFRAEKRSAPDQRAGKAKSENGKGKGKAIDEEEGEKEWDYTLSYVSSPMNGREYSEMCVRQSIGVEIAGLGRRGDIEGFIEALGFKHSHSYTRTGYLIHLPLPLPSPTPLTLHLSITRISPLAPTSDPNPNTTPAPNTSEPYLLVLQPSRPVQAVSIRGEPGLEDMMRAMRQVADRIEGVQWESGRM